MKQNKKRPYINLETLPNGYALTVDNNEYVVFSFDKLMSEIFFRFGLQETKYCAPDFIENLMVAAASWPNQADALRQCATLQTMLKDKESEVMRLCQTHYSKDQQIKLLREALAKERYKAENYKEKALDYNDMLRKVRVSELEYEQLNMAYRTLRDQHTRLQKKFQSYLQEEASKKRNIESTRKARKKKKEAKKEAGDNE